MRRSGAQWVVLSQVFWGWKFQHLKPPPSYTYPQNGPPRHQLYMRFTTAINGLTNRGLCHPIYNWVGGHLVVLYTLGVYSSRTKVAAELGFPAEKMLPPSKIPIFTWKGTISFKRKWNIWSNHQFSGGSCEFSGANLYLSGSRNPKAKPSFATFKKGPHGHQVMQHHRPGKRSKVQGQVVWDSIWVPLSNNAFHKGIQSESNQPTKPTNKTTHQKLTWLAETSPFFNRRYIFKWLFFYCHVRFRFRGTPWKINMEPSNHPLRKENDLNQTSRELCSSR